MLSDFPRNPKLLKGALVEYESQILGPVPNVIVFQSNPDQLTRTPAHCTTLPDSSNVGAAKEDLFRVLGPPVENITNLTVELDATDQLAGPHTDSHRAQTITRVLASLGDRKRQSEKYAFI
jgi:hypothetical protein